MTTTIAIFSNTPLWVWILLLFLIKRGISALHCRETSVKNIFIIPVLFLAASIYHLAGFSFFPAIPLYITTLVIFCIVRMAFLWHSPVEYNAATGVVTHPGSPFILTLIIGSFIFKFVMTCLTENDPKLLMNLSFQCLWGAGSGIATGLSWGGLLYVIYKIKEKKKTISLHY